ncbi:unnamed protein product [Paramecium primaurelia]|uniref:Uncharacterized protein n=1 Tax=Paramecium primaurelia TaxID=5886 RepID=A0A8S1K739_PARPR|nr:unnamed protein product [Paramecium primaurelia]
MQYQGQNDKEIIEVEGKQSYWNGQHFLQNTTYHYYQIQGSEIYIKDGQVVKKERIINSDQKTQINLNLQQVKYLNWDGKYGSNNQKVGQWRAFWKDNLLNVGGIYDENGLKQGTWIDIGFEYWNECQTTYVGSYKDGKKIGKWNILFENQIYGGGQYDEKSNQKIGQWIELYENFWNQCQVTKIGEYKNGIRVGRWDFLFENNILGGGVYESGVKIGKWVDLYQDFQNYCQVIQKGEYQNGIKHGEWETLFREYSNEEFKIIGLETYDQEQGINKVDLHRNFNLQQFNQQQQKRWCQVISKGVVKQDKRYGNWDILYRYSSKHQFQTIGGGLYDMKNGKKNGKWIELHEHFKTDLCEIIYLGEYLDGRKAGRWIIKFRVESDQDFETIGGGLYNDLNGQKIGEWIDLHENYDRDWCQIKYKGIYNNGIKNGKWDIHFRVAVDEEFIVIGGGHYNGNNGLKHGEWLDLHPNFNCHNQIMLKGQYQNGEFQGNFTELKLD